MGHLRSRKRRDVLRLAVFGLGAIFPTLAGGAATSFARPVLSAESRAVLECVEVTGGPFLELQPVPGTEMLPLMAMTHGRLPRFFVRYRPSPQRSNVGTAHSGTADPPIVGALRIRVVDQTGAPVPNAEVRVQTSPISIEHQITSPEGLARTTLSCKAGASVLVQAEGFRRAQVLVPECNGPYLLVTLNVGSC